MLSVQVVSRETIKPSSATPDNLSHLRLSLLDQLAPSLHIPLILFYSSNETAGKLIQLKKSLSEALTTFYPLAGRIKQEDDSGYIYVECNDQGAEFYEAQVDGVLSEFLQHPSMKESSKLLPSVVFTDVPLYIQFSVFNCGGIALGVSLSHRFGDGASLSMFINWWADATRGGGDLNRLASPSFGFASVFPPRIMKRLIQEPPPMMGDKLVYKRFLFQTSKIALLREKVNSCSKLKSPTGASLFPTRVEAVTSLIWRCSMRARGEAGKERKPVAMHAVNIRGRMDPPLPENSFGNLWIPALATGKRVLDDSCSDLGYVEGLLSEAIRSMKGDNIREVLGSDVGMGINFSPGEWEKYGIDFSMFSSWCRFPLYESDFGWGTPEWLGSVGVPLKNVVVFLPTKEGEGIEAWVQMIEEEMAKFEQDPELLAFVTVIG